MGLNKSSISDIDFLSCFVRFSCKVKMDNVQTGNNMIKEQKTAKALTNRSSAQHKILQPEEWASELALKQSYDT